MDEGIVYLIGGIIVVVIVVYIVLLIVSAVVTIGLVLLGGIGSAGALRGVFVAGKNFSEVAQEAHEKVPR